MTCQRCGNPVGTMDGDFLPLVIGQSVRKICLNCEHSFRKWWLEGDPNFVPQTQHETQSESVPLLAPTPPTRTDERIDEDGRSGPLGR